MLNKNVTLKFSNLSTSIIYYKSSID